MNRFSAISRVLFEALPSEDQAVWNRTNHTDERWPHLVDRVLSMATEMPARSLDELFPALAFLGAFPIDQTHSRFPSLPAWSERTKNILLRLQRQSDEYKYWPGIAQMKIGDLASIRNLGSKTLNEIVTVSLGLASRVTASHAPTGGNESGTSTCASSDSGSTVVYVPSENRAEAELFGAVHLLRQWALVVGGEGTLIRAMAMLAKMPAPEDVEKAYEILFKAEIETDIYSDESPVADLENLWNSLDDIDRKILLSRTFSERKTPLREIGAAFGLTGERVRVRANQAESRLKEGLSSPNFSGLRWRIQHFAGRCGVIIPPDGTELSRSTISNKLAMPGLSDELLRMVMMLAGPYSYSAGWWTSVPFDRLVETYQALADAHGLLPDTFREFVRDSGVSEELLDDVLLQLPDVANLYGRYVVWRGSMSDKAVTVLAVLGEPSDSSTLFDLVGPRGTIRSFLNALQADGRISRVGKDLYGLSEWELPAYDGVARAIEASLRESTSPQNIEELAEELHRQFGVARSSVRTFCRAPIFVIEGDTVRLRRAGDGFAIDADVSGIDWVTKVERGLTLRYVVDRDMLRGSGRSLPSQVVCALGMVPGDELDFSGTAGLVRVSWPTRSADGGRISSLRSVASYHGRDEGDVINITLEPSLLRYRISVK